MRITVQEKRDAAIEVGFRALAGRLELDLDTFRERLEGWDVKAFCDGEKPVGMLMVKGPELHVAVLPEVRGKWLSRRLIREVFSPLLKKYGEAKTKVMPDNSNGSDFVRRLGFLGDDVLTLRAGFVSGAFDPISATAATVGASALGGIMQADAAKKAAGIQADAANNATAEQARQYDLARSDAAPYRAAGSAALDRINAGLGPNGSFASSFTSSDLENDPIYQKALQWATTQGTQAINRAAAARGGIDSGSTLKGIVDYALGSASQYGNDAFNRFQTQQSNLFNRNASVAGLGQTAVGQTTAAGANAANNISDLITGAGNARAASIVGGANALTGAANNIANYYTGQQTLDKVLRAGGGYNPYAIYSSPVANSSIASQLPG